MEIIKIEEVLQICNAFIETPTNEVAVDNFEDLKVRLVVRSYLPVQEKVLCLYKMVIDSDKSIDLPSSIFTIGLDIAAVFDGLIAYTNIDLNIHTDLKSYESYDSLYQSGLADYILEFCEKDYNRLVRLLERTVSYDNLVELTETIGAIDSEGMKAVVQEFRRFREETNPAVLKDISDIIRYNDPNLHQLKSEVVDEALEQLEKMDKLEKADLKNFTKK